ncbi:hypothetical protein SAMN03084138_00560 [Enterovibrio norvegicus DSM 15893]|uniref:Uncharacterized protein n=1 Tax=Enterovibrio norvegicus DSM 15893 TaxID=1121869 RepID=A0A1I5KBH3_9GAMM|nr:hypothetical protein SAMN03084138_00560 [Enterovibrio norvegicus DSM 15893]
MRLSPLIRVLDACWVYFFYGKGVEIIANGRGLYLKFFIRLER